MSLILGICLIVSLLVNAYTLYFPEVKVEYKEIEVEVVKRAMCECGHPSSVHTNKFGLGCRENTIIIDGRTMNRASVCACMRYVGPTPMSEYFDDQLDVTTVPFKELAR